MPNTAGQAAGACVFAFISLLAFELLRPHISHTDAWMYRVVRLGGSLIIARERELERCSWFALPLLVFLLGT